MTILNSDRHGSEHFFIRDISAAETAEEFMNLDFLRVLGVLRGVNPIEIRSRDCV